jgi:diguanylate cyclase (GGDEF)-like protein
MMRNADADRIRRNKAVGNARQQGQRRGTGDAATGASGSRSTSKQRASALQELTSTLDKCRRQLKSARLKIEMLVDQNGRLQQDVLALAQKEAQARHAAYRDTLTGLPNCSLLQDRFQQALSQAERRHRPLALLLLDLDEFKCVNDRMGHSRGDLLLRAVAERLGAVVRGADTACRYGGDEFVILLPELDHPDRVAAVATKIRSCLGAPYIIDGYRVRMTVSVGAVVYPADGRTYDELMKRADVAMYLAKGEGCAVSITALPDKPISRDKKQTPDALGKVNQLRNRDLANVDERTRGQPVRADGGAPPPWSAARWLFRSN